jgi:hypothetical protein
VEVDRVVHRGRVCDDPFFDRPDRHGLVDPVGVEFLAVNDEAHGAAAHGDRERQLAPAGD